MHIKELSLLLKEIRIWYWRIIRRVITNSLLVLRTCFNGMSRGCIILIGMSIVTPWTFGVIFIFLIVLYMKFKIIFFLKSTTYVNTTIPCTCYKIYITIIIKHRRHFSLFVRSWYTFSSNLIGLILITNNILILKYY